MTGNYDAWQGLWNLQHAERFLRGETPLWFSERVWAPEGASLVFHALSPGLTIPGALIARATNPFIAYNSLVLLCFAFAAAFLHRLARRTGASVLGGVLAALAFCLAPLYTTRVAAGHLNLLGAACFPAALEGLVLATRRQGQARLLGVVLAGTAMAFSVYVDFYLALLCSFVLVVTAVSELSCLRGAALWKAIAALLGAGLLSALLAWPLLSRVARATERVEGHDPRSLSVEPVALVVPGRAQAVHRLVSGLEGHPDPPEVEKNSYLGLLPLAALAWSLFSRPSRFHAGVSFAAGVCLVLALGPVLQIAGKETAIPMPYQLLQKFVPALASGGGVNRFLLLVPLALALSVGLAVTALSARPSTKKRVLLALLVAAFVIESLPANPGVSSAPYNPPDPAMLAIARQRRLARQPPLAHSASAGGVLDLDPGIPNLFRQLRHERPQVWGYLSRAPRAALERRLRDPLLGPLYRQEDRAGAPTTAGAPAAARLPREASAFLLREYWGIGFLTGPDCSPFIDRASSFGFPVLMRSGLSFAFTVPASGITKLTRADLSLPDPEALRLGVRLEGLSGPLEGTRWIGSRAEVFFPADPGEWEVSVSDPQSGTSGLTLRWGDSGKALEWPLLPGRNVLGFSVTGEDLTPGGGLLLRFETVPGGSGTSGVRLLAIERR